MRGRITTEVSANVATVTLNRPEKHNAVDLEMLEGLAEAADMLAARRGIRAIVLHGSGKHFCAGIDISIFRAFGDGNGWADKMQPVAGSTANVFQRAATVWRDLPVPVIAVLRGNVFGAGFQIAMGADVRIAAPDVQMSIMEINWGLVPDMGLTTTVPGVIAQDRVRHLAFTGHVMAADECFACGAVTEVISDPLTAAQTLADKIATRSPDAIRAIKSLINASWNDDTASALRREAEQQLAVLAGDNQKEAVRANLENREPKFVDPI